MWVLITVSAAWLAQPPWDWLSWNGAPGFGAWRTRCAVWLWADLQPAPSWPWLPGWNSLSALGPVLWGSPYSPELSDTWGRLPARAFPWAWLVSNAAGLLIIAASTTAIGYQERLRLHRRVTGFRACPWSSALDPLLPASVMAAAERLRSPGWRAGAMLRRFRASSLPRRRYALIA